MNIVAQRFGETLRRLRIDADLSQEQLGHRASLHRTEIGLLERGARVPRIDTILKLASGLRIAPETLLEGITWKPGGVTRGAFHIGEPDQPAATSDRAASRHGEQLGRLRVDAEACATGDDGGPWRRDKSDE